MIAAGEPVEFSPFGSEHLVHHPGSVKQSDCRNRDEQASEAPSADLSEALSGVSLHGNRNRRNEFWRLRGSYDEDSDGEEELYVSGDTIVWSRSDGCDVRSVLRTFCLESAVHDAQWCTFLLDDYETRLLVKQQAKTRAEPVPCLCVLDSCGTLHSFSRAGEDFTTAMPFPVSRMWEINHGLLFERSSLKNANQRLTSEVSVLFSLLHPLDEVAPVITRAAVHGDIPKFGYLYDTENAEVVSASVEPSMLLMYHRESGAHSVWSVRRMTEEEDRIAANLHYGDRPTEFSSTFHSPMSSLVNSPVPHSTPVASQRFHGGLSSSLSQVVRAQSTSLTHMATLSRSQSPLQNSIAHHHCNYDSLTGSSRMPLNDCESGSRRSYACGCAEPLLPDVCLEKLWKEPKETVSHEKANKMFFAKDFLGEKFLCYLLPQANILKLIRYEEGSASSGTAVNFGKSFAIPAVDAESLQPLGMILTLDSNLSLTLYTGGVKVCKVHVPTSLTALGLHSYRQSSLCVRVVSCTPKKSSPSIDVGSRMFGSFENLGVSPVLKTSFPSRDLLSEDTTSPSQICLRDAVGSRVTFELASGSAYRITLPAMSKSSIVRQCLEAFRRVLPRDLAASLHAKWYMSRNAPGPTDTTVSSELRSFLIFVLGMTGYSTENLTIKRSRLEQSQCDAPSPIAPKKSKSSERGSESDWEYLLASRATAKSPSVTPKPLPRPSGHSDRTKPLHFELGCFTNSSAPLFPHIHSVFFCVHLIYEESKLNVLLWDLLPILAEFLFKISSDLCLSEYRDSYRRDFPDQFGNSGSTVAMQQDTAELPDSPSYFTVAPPSVFEWMQQTLRQGGHTSPFPYISEVTELTKNMVLLCPVLASTSERRTSSSVLSGVPVLEDRIAKDIDKMLLCLPSTSTSERVVTLLVALGVGPKDLGTWPSGIAAIVRDVISQCQEYPPPGWTGAAYELIGRQDLVALSSGVHEKRATTTSAAQLGQSKSPAPQGDDGFNCLEHEVLRLRFSKDRRINEVCRMLQSSVPVSITIQQRPDVSDHEFIEEQERHLYSLSIRTMALPPGRGMFTLQTHDPVVTETLPIPKLCLTGRVPSRNTTVDMLHIDVPPNMNVWPLFHNGVAAGLRVSRTATSIDSSWIVYNKARAANNVDATVEHAGFLLGLGLNGHLNNLSTIAIHDYLLKNHELTSVGLLLGLAASKRGTMDLAGTKLMSIHVEALLPPTSTELDVHSSVRVASVMGLGLLYAESGHRHMAEVLLGEVGRPPGPEMDHCVDRESYALASGIAFGMVMLGKGSQSIGLSDLPMADRLYRYMVGGHVKQHGFQQERYRFPCYQIREGNCVNVDVTSPGATLALGLMFFNTGNATVAGRMTVPGTRYFLDTMRPDFFLLRTLSKGLILWSEVYPRREWVEGHLPEVVSKHAFSECPTEDDVDYETMGQVYCNILAGACFCLGLKFAGSANGEAYHTLCFYVKRFMDLQRQPAAEQAGKNTVETCLMVMILSLALVMAGTGDLVVLRYCRHLRSRASQAFPYVLYGSHMATHLALGLLFLGGGNLTLDTSPLSVAAMICAFFPRFPIHSNDNRYHLQALRHLYVLAVQPRLIVPVDVVTGNAVYVHLTVAFKETDQYDSCEYTTRAPCHLPELHLLKSVTLRDPRYWPIVLTAENWDTLKRTLEQKGRFYVRQKAGCLPYSVDPKGYKTTFARSAISDLVRGWLAGSGVSEPFSEDPVVSKVTECFLQPRAASVKELALQHSFCKILMECTLREKADALSTLFDLFLITWSNHKSCTLPLWQFKLILAYYNPATERKDALLYADLVFSLEHAVASRIEDDVPDTKVVVDYLDGCDDGCSPTDLFPFLVLHDMPPPQSLAPLSAYKDLCPPELWLSLKSIGVNPTAATVLASVLT